MSEGLRVLVADDESMARKRLVRLLEAIDAVEVAGECADGAEVLAAVKAGGVDVVLLDIQMPGLTGTDAVALWPAGGPAVVYCTAHAEHAVRAFEQGAVDYLLKPIEPDRLKKALERVRARGQGDAKRAATEDTGPLGGETEPLQRLAVPTRQGVVLLDPATITHAVLADELVTVHAGQSEYLTDFSLQELESRLPKGRFMRVHRRALLNLEAVTRLEPLETGGYLARIRPGQTVEVSRQAARELRRMMGLRKPAGEPE